MEELKNLRNSYQKEKHSLIEENQQILRELEKYKTTMKHNEELIEELMKKEANLEETLNEYQKNHMTKEEKLKDKNQKLR